MGFLNIFLLTVVMAFSVKGETDSSTADQLNKAFSLASKQKYAEALVIYDSLVREDPKKMLDVSSRFWFHKGSCEKKLNKLNEAKISLQRGAMNESKGGYWKLMCGLTLAEIYFEAGEIYASNALMWKLDSDINSHKWKFESNKKRVIERHRKLMKKFKI